MSVLGLLGGADDDVQSRNLENVGHSQLKIIDYDEIDEWEPWIGAMVVDIGSQEVVSRLQRDKPEYLEDAGALLCDLVGRSKLIDRMAVRLEPYAVRVYHGTRVTESEHKQIVAEGLQPLTLVDRKPALAAIFSQHSGWSEAESRFDDAIRDFGSGNAAGRREDNCVHVCFSRAGLLLGCKHYLTHGAEVDSHIAHRLFPGDQTALDLLLADRTAMLVSFLTRYPEAARAANPHGVPNGELPALLGLLINAWAFRQAHPEFSVASLRDCTAARFDGPVPATLIENIERVDDSSLSV